jgi:hypothetical protein
MLLQLCNWFERVLSRSRFCFNNRMSQVKWAAEHFPKQGFRAPWTVKHSYWHDKRVLLFDPIEDGVLRFTM